MHLSKIMLLSFGFCLFVFYWKDKSCEIIASWKPKLQAAGILVEIGGHSGDDPKGGTEQFYT